VVIGASSGIGRASARAFAERGDRLVLAARGEVALKQTGEECRTLGAAAVEIAVADVLDADAVDRLLAGVVEEFGRVDVVVHSATVMAYGHVEDVPAEVFERVVDTAVHGTANVARSTLPRFRAQRSGCLIVVNSLVGTIVAPHMGAYATAKWGQLGLLRTLQLEVRNEPDVHVCTVSPGGVDTPIYYQAANYAGRAGRPPPPVDPPAKVARAIVRCADRPRRHVSVGPFNPIIVLGFRTMPWLYDRLVTPLMAIAALSRDGLAATEGNVFSPIVDAEAERGRWPHRWR
jgi:NAD(P)-dependent dehydrogenase (short-subunit alcohol dehydrogenase family)